MLFFFSVFISITISRFVIDGENKVISGLISYFAQQFGNFNNQFNNLPLLFSGAGNLSYLFPILDFFNNSTTMSFLEMNNFYQFKYGFDPNVFSTFLGSFYFKIGFWKTLIFCFIFMLFGLLIMKKHRSLSFGRLLLVTLYSQLILHGLFYYKLSYSVSSIYIITVFFLSFVFSFKIRIGK